MTFVYFILLLGGLIFFHELGHFLVARLMGVHVATFSIGFGPTLFKIKGRRKREDIEPTEYVIAALPLGGYVRMLGDDPTEDMPDHLRDVSFNHKPVWRRFLIVAAGPVFNLVLPYLIYLGLGLSASQLSPSSIGMVTADDPAATAGMQAGDRIVSIDGEDVQYWWQVQKLVSERPGQTVDVQVDRPGADELLTLRLTPQTVSKRVVPGLDYHDEQGRIGVVHAYVKPYLGVVEDSPVWRAGLRTGDRVTAVDGEPVHRIGQVLDALEAATGPVKLDFVRHAVRTPLGAVGEQRSSAVIPSAAGVAPARGAGSYACMLEEVLERSPAEKLGLVAGDILLSLDGVPCRRWDVLVSSLREAPDQEHTLVWAHDGEVRRARSTEWIGSVVVPSSEAPDRTVRAFGVRPVSLAHIYGVPELVPNEHRARYALELAIDESYEALRVNVLAIAGLFMGDVPMKELSGPVGIFDLASRTEDLGMGYFWRLMVFLSISLGLINLLPIPVLDGGHIAFLAIEAVRRKAVSLRTRQIATYIGLAFIILLMVVALRNDFQRLWG